MADSSYSYTAVITNMNVGARRMTVQYSRDNVDSSRPAVARQIALGQTEFNDSDISAKIKAIGRSVGAEWYTNATYIEANLDVDVDSFIGDSFGFTYKPAIADSFPSFDAATQYVTSYESEGLTEIRTKYTVLPLDSAQLQIVQANYSIEKSNLWKKLLEDGYLPAVRQDLGVGEDIQASWDASAGAGYTWGAGEIKSYGVDSVSRQAEGTYRVHFAHPLADSNYTVSTGVGAENYGGAGASPRQLTVTERTPTYVEVHCERTDDAVDEDNAYMSVQVSVPSLVTASDIVGIDFMYGASFQIGDSVLDAVQVTLGMNDSDFDAYIRV